MNCEEARMLLDAYVDGELSQEEMLALKDHAKACKACAEELKAALLLKDTLAHMDDDIEVPLQAQAAWRGAVRAEAKKRNGRKWMRGAYAAVAALVLVLGVSLGFNGGNEPQTALTMEKSAATQAIIARDGTEQTAVNADAGEDDYTVRKKIGVSSMEEAAQALEMLSAEYSGVCSLDAEGICRIEIPYEYLQDFLKAASHIGEDEYSEIADRTAGTAIVLIQITEE